MMTTSRLAVLASLALSLTPSTQTSTSDCSLCDSLTQDECYTSLISAFESLSDKQRLSFYESSSTISSWEDLCAWESSTAKLSDKQCLSVLDTVFGDETTDEQGSSLLASCASLSTYLTSTSSTTNHLDTSVCALCDSMDDEECVEELMYTYSLLTDKARLAFYKGAAVFDATTVCAIGTSSELNDKSCLAALDTAFTSETVEEQQGQLLESCSDLDLDTSSSTSTTTTSSTLKFMQALFMMADAPTCSLCDSLSEEDCLTELMETFSTLSDKSRLAFLKASSVVDAETICSIGTSTELNDKSCLAALDSVFSAESLDSQSTKLLENCADLDDYVTASSSTTSTNTKGFIAHALMSSMDTSSCALCQSLTEEDCLDELMKTFSSLNDKSRLAFYKESSSFDATSVCAIGTTSQLTDKECLAALDAQFAGEITASQQSKLLHSCSQLDTYYSSSTATKTMKAKSHERTTVTLSAAHEDKTVVSTPSWTWGAAFQNMLIGFFGGAFVATLVLVLARTRVCRSLKTKIMKSRDMLSVSRYNYANLDEEEEPRKFGTVIEGDFRESLEDDPFAITL